MKKRMCLILALMMALSLACAAALADEEPQPEGGRKFEGCWAKMCGLIEIVYEEEGYRVLVDLFDQEDNTGVQWEYSCFYNGEKDALESFSSCKTGYALDPETLEAARGECEYEGIDDEGAATLFFLTDEGALVWKDGHENIGQDLEFRNIGAFDGVWRNEDEEVYAEIRWEGLYDENLYCYSVFVARGSDDHYADFHLVGAYNPDNGKLECYDTDGAPIRDAEDLFAAQDAGKPCDMLFSALGNGKILYETENGIELAYDLLGPES